RRREPPRSRRGAGRSARWGRSSAGWSWRQATGARRVQGEARKRPGREEPPGRAVRWSEGRDPTPGGPGSSVVFTAVRRNGRLSGEPPHMSDKNSLLGSPPSLWPPTVGPPPRGGNGLFARTVRADRFRRPRCSWKDGPRPSPLCSTRSPSVQSVLTDSLEKVLGDESPRPAAVLDGVHAAGFLDERLSLQLAVRLDEHEQLGERWVRLAGSAAHLATVSAVRRVPVSHPAPEDADEHYLATEPGEYPDLLEPLPEDTVLLVPGQWEALWIDVRATEVADAGDHDLTI